MVDQKITSYFEKHQSDIWVLINIIIPIVPIVIGGIIRIAYSPEWTFTTLIWNTISASDLAICISLLSLLIFLSLIRNKEILDTDGSKEAEKIRIAIVFLIIILLSIFLYTAITIGNTTAKELKDEKYMPTLHCFEFIMFILTIVTLRLSISTQRSFKLKADIL